MANHELAEKDYMSGMKYQDIADKYGVSVNTVKSWKKRYAWERKKDGKGAHKSKKDAHKTEKGCTQKEDVKRGSRKKKELVEDEINEVSEVLKNAELTDKQRLFCLYFIRSFNATKAYQKAYQCSYETAMVRGSETLRNVKVKEQIKKIKQEKFNREFLSESDIFQKYMDIAFADMNDYIEIKGNTLSFKDSNNFDGTLIKKVSTGKVSSIELKDSMKALDWIAGHMDMATEEQKAKLELLKAQKVKLLKDDSENNPNDKATQAKDNIMSILSQIKPIKDGDVLE